MINRSREAIDAIGFAEALANPGEGKRLDVLQQYRQSDALALVPSSAMDLRQHYADLIAEYVAAKGAAEDNDPEAERIRDFGEDFEEKFRALFGEGTEYHQYGGAVFRTHELYCKFAEAAAAYALLRPGVKGAPDAVPAEEAILNAMAQERARKKPLTFDVYANMISPMERYARAKSMPPPADCEQVRIPRSLLAMVSDADEASRLDDTAAQDDTDALAGMQEIAAPTAEDAARKKSSGKKTVCPEELALAAMLYYRHRPKAVGRRTEFFPVAVREAGAYLTNGDQAKIIGKLREHARLLIYNEIYFVGRGNQERQIMVALKQMAVNQFEACNKDDARRDTYFEITADKPRAIVDAIRTENQREMQDRKLLVSYLTRNKDSESYVPWAENKDALLKLLQKILEKRLVDVLVNGGGNMRSKAQAPFDRVTDPGGCILKLCMAAYVLDLNLTDCVNLEIDPGDLRLFLQEDPETVFWKLERVWTDVFATGMTMSYGWKVNKAVFRCTLKHTLPRDCTPSM